MPMLGRSEVNGSRWRRWGSRFYTRLYVETHVRKQLQAIRDCLRLERLGRTAEEENERIASLDAELERTLEPLFRWRRLTGLLARLPPVAAAVPIVSAASVWPLADDVSARTVLYALLTLAGTALALWILVVWPSIRLGFRVKRAIFAGGRDLQHPFFNRSDWLEWRGFPAPAFYDDRTKGRNRSRTFPKTNVYRAENAVYRALGRRKPAEVPLDLLLAFAPYLWVAYSVFFVYGLVDAIVSGELWETPSDSAFGLLFAAVFALAVVAFPLQGTKNYRLRPH